MASVCDRIQDRCGRVTLCLCLPSLYISIYIYILISLCREGGGRLRPSSQLAALAQTDESEPLNNHVWHGWGDLQPQREQTIPLNPTMAWAAPNAPFMRRTDIARFRDATPTWRALWGRRTWPSGAESAFSATSEVSESIEKSYDEATAIKWEERVAGAALKTH